jgi:hypothetical protein
MGCCNPKLSDEDKFNMTMQAQASLEKSPTTFQDMSMSSQHRDKHCEEIKFKLKGSVISSRSSIEASFLHILNETSTPKFGSRVRTQDRKVKKEAESDDKENIYD